MAWKIQEKIMDFPGCVGTPLLTYLQRENLSVAAAGIYRLHALYKPIDSNEALNDISTTAVLLALLN